MNAIELLRTAIKTFAAAQSIDPGSVDVRVGTCEVTIAVKMRQTSGCHRTAYAVGHGDTLDAAFADCVPDIADMRERGHDVRA